MSNFEGRVALVTGAARGVGRCCALALAEQGADLLLTDYVSDVPSITYKLSSADELEQTVEAAKALGSKVVAETGDVRNQNALDGLVAKGVDAYGHIDIASINAGIASHGMSWELDEAQWQDVLDVNLTGAWHTAKSVIPTMIEQGSGALIFMSSVSGLKGAGGLSAYVASKHGLVGLMRALAIELGPHNIRANAVCPGAVNTPMTINEKTLKMFRPDLEEPALDDAADLLSSINLLPVPVVEPEDVASTVAFLASDACRHVTGATLPVDAGSFTK